MIVFDLQAVQSAAHGERGIARFVSDVASTLATEHPGVVDVFAWNDQLPFVPRLDALGLGDRLRPFSELRDREVDVLHVNSPFELLEYGDVGVPVRPRRTVVTCYDLIPYRFPHRYLTDPVTNGRYRTRLGMLASADAVVTDSQSAADDVHELLGVARRRLTVIGGGVGPQFVPPTTTLEERMDELRAEIPGLLPNFVLVPTGMDWRKNVEGAIEAFGLLPAELRDRHQLVLACKVDEHQRAWIDGLAEGAGVADRLVVTGFVSDETLVLLYQTTELVLFPSFYEGFGLPVVEARACGARVVCSNASSLPEVLRDERATFNPWVVEEIAEVLERALGDASFAAELDRVPDAGFTWSQAAERLVGVYDGLREPAVGSAAPSKPAKRLGIVTLMPPTPSGVADHSKRMIDAIHEHVDGVDVSVFVEQTATWSAELPYSVHELATLIPRWQTGELDAVLYCFGNNRWHRPFYPLMRIVPGHAFLHDVRLLGAFDQRRLNELARDLYDGNPDGDALFAQPIARSAMSVLVQSAHAAELVAADGGGLAIDVGPHPCEVVTDATLIVDEGLPWVVSAGIADETKLSDVVADAMRLLVREGRARAAIVGLGGDRFADDGDGIVVTGQVGAGEFDEWLRRASVLVQLRGVTNGESSGVAAHALARGVPLIVSDLGAMAELPADTAVRVAPDVTASALATSISALLDDPDRRTAMRSAGLAFAAEQTPLAQARRVVDAIFP
ncbi:MAG: glycosyltransferase [Ilumatobacter sp.]|nr:glycosyltransferase [Ilumatobacter sp.]